MVGKFANGLGAAKSRTGSAKAKLPHRSKITWFAGIVLSDEWRVARKDETLETLVRISK
jgi:hypothetical protein